VLAREQDVYLVVNVVSPHAIRAELVDDVGVVSLVLEEDVPRRLHGVREVGELAEDVGPGPVVNGVRGVEAQRVDAELLEPVTCVLQHQASHRLMAEVGCRPPRRLDRLREVLGRVPREVVSGRSKVIAYYI
jgi:hypothetical protein